METIELMEMRHSVRQYINKPIEEEKRKALLSLMTECNEKSGLNIQILFDEPEAFDTAMAHYGKFSNVQNYIALVGPKQKGTEEKCGYYGQQLVLRAQELGLNTCWVALSYGKRKCAAQIGSNEKLICVIALGYGATKGVPHRSKPLSSLCEIKNEMPEWFNAGMKAATLAPTAMNQQKFYFTLNNGEAFASCSGGFYTKLDLGIVKYSFEAASGHIVKQA